MVVVEAAGMELKEFVEDQLKEHSEEVKEIVELQRIMELLPPENQGFYFTINAVSNGD